MLRFWRKADAAKIAQLERELLHTSTAPEWFLRDQRQLQRDLAELDRKIFENDYDS